MKEWQYLYLLLKYLFGDQDKERILFFLNCSCYVTDKVEKDFCEI